MEWSWTKEFIDSLHGCGSRNLEIVGARSCRSRGMSLEEICEEWRRRSRISAFTAYLEVTRKTKEVK